MPVTLSSASLPTWVDRGLYPFTPRPIRTTDGTMSVVDEGQGSPVIFVHGHLGWSFGWRGAVRTLSKSFRCIAPDLLGFGLSDKPAEPLSMAAHAHHLVTLLDGLNVQDATIVLHDTAGPSGLWAALERPERIRRIMLVNTWCWSLDPASPAGKVAKMAGSPLGGLAYRTPSKLIKPLMHHRQSFDDVVCRNYAGPFSDRAACGAAQRLAQAGLTEAAWCNLLWDRKEELATRPLSMVWGLKDPLLGERTLDKWWHAFPLAEVQRMSDTGAFPFEENPTEFVESLRRFASATGDESRFVA